MLVKNNNLIDKLTIKIDYLNLVIDNYSHDWFEFQFNRRFSHDLEIPNSEFYINWRTRTYGLSVGKNVSNPWRIPRIPRPLSKGLNFWRSIAVGLSRPKRIKFN